MNKDLEKQLSQTVQISSEGQVVAAPQEQFYCENMGEDDPWGVGSQPALPGIEGPKAPAEPAKQETAAPKQSRGGVRMWVAQRLLYDGQPVPVNRVVPVWDVSSMERLAPTVLDTVIAVILEDGRLLTAPGKENLMLSTARERFMQLDGGVRSTDDIALMASLRGSLLGNVGGRVQQHASVQPVGLFATGRAQHDWEHRRLVYQPLSVYDWLETTAQLPSRPALEFTPVRFWVEDPDGAPVRMGMEEDVITVAPIALPIAFTPLPELLNVDEAEAWDMYLKLLQRVMEECSGKIFMGRVNPERTDELTVEFSDFPYATSPYTLMDDGAAHKILDAVRDTGPAWQR